MARKKRILFISHHGTMSGAPISLLTLMKHFAATRDWEFQVLMRKEGPLRSEFEKLAPTHVYYQHFLDPADMRPENAKRPPLPEDVRRRKFRQWRHEQRLRLIMKQFSPDLVYSNTTVNGDLLAKLGLRKPTLIHVRELWTTVALYSQVQLNAFTHPRYRYFAVSEFVRKYLEEKFSISRDRVDIVPGSMEPDVFDKKAEDKALDEMRQELSLPVGTVIVGGLGSVDSRKGVDYFVDTALDVLHSEPPGPAVYFVWIGNGSMRQEMLGKVAAAGFTGRVIFPGARKNPYPYLKLFDIGLMTSRDDPFPRSVMEMAAFGAPIICFKGSGGAAEFVQDDAGIVLDDFSAAGMADAVRSMLANNELKAAFAIAARRKAREDYETTRVGERAACLLEQMMADNRTNN